MRKTSDRPWRRTLKTGRREMSRPEAALITVGAVLFLGLTLGGDRGAEAAHNSNIYSVTETTPYAAEVHVDPYAAPGARKLIAPGRRGLRTVTYRLTAGGREVVSETILSEPETELILTGPEL